MKYKGYISKSYFDPTTWNNHVVNSDIWERTFDVNESDFIVYVDNSEKIETDKFKILYLIESQQILGVDYNTIVSRLMPDLIVTFNTSISSDAIKILTVPPPFKSWINEPGIYPKTKLCSMICSMFEKTYFQKYRVGVYNKLKDTVDCFGKHTNYIENKLDGLKDYCFSVAIENDVIPGYFSEKILDCFMSGTVPLYVGDPEIGRYFDKRGILFYDDSFDMNQLSFDKYKEMLPYVEHNYKVACSLNISFDDYFLRGVNEFKNIRSS